MLWMVFDEKIRMAFGTSEVRLINFWEWSGFRTRTDPDYHIGGGMQSSVCRSS